ncbi:class F sortase [Streptomyces hoynatensis]|uniref:Class F sortase n=1 Tax=Streptomyces hoynatensis TaxID=1141874 RepID=A0A3A9YJY5_9ACTN|nr:class F sortase [Streptomyces hoynatensis]
MGGAPREPRAGRTPRGPSPAPAEGPRARAGGPGPAPGRPGPRRPGKPGGAGKPGGPAGGGRLLRAVVRVPLPLRVAWRLGTLPVRAAGRAAGRCARRIPPLVAAARGRLDWALGRGLATPRTTRHQRLAFRSRRLEVAAAVAAVAAGVGAGLLAPGPGDAVRAAQASSSIAEGVSRPGAVDAPADPPDAGSTAGLDPWTGEPSAVVAPPLNRSVPTRLRIPQLGTDVEVFGAELGTDGGPPAPAEEDAMRAAWYSGGVSPGERGPAIMVGHLDTYTGPAAFAGLGQLRPGETIEIDREDGQTAIFTVDSVEQYPKTAFPDERVYGSVESPQLRLITCGGAWTANGGYDSNIVAYARLTASMPTKML